MRTVIFSPPLRHVSGGLAAIWDLAGILSRQGRRVALVSAGADRTPPELPARIPRLLWNPEGTFLHPDDLWLVPEGWPNAIAPGIRAGAHVLVYVQNWAFMMTTLPESVTWKKLAAGSRPARPMRFLAASGPVRYFLCEILGLDEQNVMSDVLPPAVHPAFFREHARSGGRVRVAFMPRKNKALADQVRRIALALLEAAGIETEFVSVRHLDHEAVAGVLASCHIFLSTGFPEGFALPPAEAMACGCVPVGFSGLGGFEYMRNPEPHPLPGLFEPPFALARKFRGGNGLFVADGDVLGAARALTHAVGLARADNGRWKELVGNGLKTALAYSRQSLEEKVDEIWKKFDQTF
ncbi:MAG: glycosyltransferase family 1 protein [Desulfovibrio sp.]|jgi:glycosyltransferase involved in cell wall biosynthesis|nr:glycosyltransferase family 1 protein [Desulfovibrio sp.]